MDRHCAVRRERRKNTGFAGDVYGAVDQAVLRTRHDGRNLGGCAWPQACEWKRPLQSICDLWLDADLNQSLNAQLSQLIEVWPKPLIGSASRGTTPEQNANGFTIGKGGNGIGFTNV
jgi:hypothetical protein